MMMLKVFIVLLAAFTSSQAFAPTPSRSTTSAAFVTRLSMMAESDDSSSPKNDAWDAYNGKYKAGKKAADYFPDKKSKRADSWAGYIGVPEDEMERFDADMKEKSRRHVDLPDYYVTTGKMDKDRQPSAEWKAYSGELNDQDAQELFPHGREVADWDEYTGQTKKEK